MARVGVFPRCSPHRLQSAASASARPSLSNIPSWMENTRALSALGREAESAMQRRHIARGGLGGFGRMEMAPCVLSCSFLGVCRWFLEKWAGGTPRSVPSCLRGSWRFRRSSSPCRLRALVSQLGTLNTASCDSLWNQPSSRTIARISRVLVDSYVMFHPAKSLSLLDSGSLRQRRR